MIAHLRGTIARHGNGYVIVDVAGVGYRVFVPEIVAQGLQGEVTLHTHEVVRDDVREIYGFTGFESLELFWKLISVSGVGPKIAQRIVCSSDVEAVRGGIVRGDVVFFRSVPGVGSKTAQKIILELRGVLADEPGKELVDRDALDALMSLGYTEKQAGEALRELEGTTEVKIRAALKSLGR